MEKSISKKVKEYVNKNKDYPELNSKQLLSLIRANQIMLTDAEDRIIELEKKVLTLESLVVEKKKFLNSKGGKK